MVPPISDFTREHLERMGSFFNAQTPESTAGARSYRRLLAHYFNLQIPRGASVLEVGCGSGELLALLNAEDKTGIDVSSVQLDAARLRVPSATFGLQAGETISLDRRYDVIVISDTLNLAADVQQLFERLRGVSHSGTRLLLNFQNSAWRPPLRVAEWIGQKRKDPGNSWLATSDVRNLLALGGWQPIRQQNRILVPFPLLGIDILLNRWIAPLVPWFCLTVFIAARLIPEQVGEKKRPLVSVIVPARNESGNIASIIQRIPQMGAGTEIIFVEGNSSDDTWPQILRHQAENPHLNITALQQPGRGKGDAVRVGFAAARGDILMILDADLTMPAEELPKFYHALESGQAELANGVRLVYPMNEQAMRFANLCANKAFSLIFTWLIGQPVKDTLCGTKVLTRAHYEKIAAQRAYFGDFDPFGDFDLLFGAANLNLRIVDVPIRYRERTYGTTNIRRWRDGMILLRMVLFAARKLKFV